jgi:hypothetical protein
MIGSVTVDGGAVVAAGAALDATTDAALDAVEAELGRGEEDRVPEGEEATAEDEVTEFAGEEEATTEDEMGELSELAEEENEAEADADDADNKVDVMTSLVVAARTMGRKDSARTLIVGGTRKQRGRQAASF